MDIKLTYMYRILNVHPRKQNLTPEFYYKRQTRPKKFFVSPVKSVFCPMTHVARPTTKSKNPNLELGYNYLFGSN